jgi:integrase
MSIRKRGHRAYQVRVAPFSARSFPTLEAAKKHELELLLRRSQGDRYIEEARTLGAEIEAWLARHQALTSVRKPTIRFYAQSARIWQAFATVQVSALRRAAVEDFIADRATRHRRAAKNELEFLKRVLRDARARGQRVDDGVLSLDPVKHTPRVGRALTVVQLYELASWIPEHSKRLVLLAGMVGARQRVWFEMTDDLLDLRNGTLAIPSWLAKNGREHQIYFTDLETGLFREQLVVRAPGTPLVFPTPTGKQWTESGFRERVWQKAVEAAVANEERPDGRTSVFEGFNFHLLRHTACSLMASAGMDPAVAAERASHTDGGALFLRKYRHLYESEKRTQAFRLEALVRASLDESWTEDGSKADSPLNHAADDDGRGWDRTSFIPKPRLATLARNHLLSRRFAHRAA